MTTPVGRATEYHIGQQSDFTTAATVLRSFHTYDFRPAPSVAGFEEDPRLGLAEHNDYDAQTPSTALPSPSLAMNIPLCTNQLGWMLEALLGARTTSGAGPYGHVFTSGRTDMADYTLIEKLAASDYRRVVGWKPNAFSIDLSRGNGYARAALSGPCREVQSPTSVTLGTVPAVLTPAIIRQRTGALSIDSVATAVTGVRCRYEREMMLNEDLSGDDLPPGYEAGQASFIWEFSKRYTSRAEYEDSLAAHTAAPIPIAFQLLQGANNSLNLSTPACRIEPMEVEVTGPGRITASFRARAEVGASAPMLTATLTNGLQATSYAWD